MDNEEWGKKRRLIMKYHGWDNDDFLEHVIDAGVNALFDWTLQCIEKDLKEVE